MIGADVHRPPLLLQQRRMDRASPDILLQPVPEPLENHQPQGHPSVLLPAILVRDLLVVPVIVQVQEGRIVPSG